MRVHLVRVGAEFGVRVGDRPNSNPGSDTDSDSGPDPDQGRASVRSVAAESFTNPSSSQTDEKFAVRSPSLAAIPAAAPPRDAQRDAFDKYDIDTNHSGKLDHKALCSALEAVGLKKTSAQAAALLAKYDKHQSGLIEFDEFQQLCTALEAVNYNLAGDA